MPMQWSPEKREAGLAKLYKKKTGRDIDFENVRTFNEKLQWLKLYWYHKDMPKIVCKYNFKKYIKAKLGEGYTVPLYEVYDDVDKIDFDKLPNEFVLKSNAQSDGNYIKIIRDKTKINEKELREEMKAWLNAENLLINSFCKAYYKVKPLILAEKYVEEIDNEAHDYKFFCFNGEPKFAYVATDHFPLENQRISLYDLNWNKMNIQYGHYPQNDIPAPKNLKQMIDIAKKLSAEFPFLRVDFFEIDGKIYLSELTFYPGGGYHEYTPESANYEWGDMLKLPSKQVFKPMKRKY